MNECERIENILEKLAENPYVGNQLQIKFFREKRLSEKRLYYLIFEDLKVVLIVSISNKKIQQKVIDSTLKRINEFREEVKNLMDNK